MSELRFTVYGLPRPKGSMRAVTHDQRGRPLRHPRLLADNSEKLDRWCKNIAGAALAAMAHQGRHLFPWRQRPIAVVAMFHFERPAGHHGARGLRPKAPLFMTVKPDVDKLLRAVLDALTGLVYDDDARIVGVSARKAWCGPDEVPGAELELVTLDDALTSQLELVAP